MSKLKTKIQTAIKSGKIRVFFLFVLLAFGILLLTKLSKDYTKTISFKATLSNVPEDKLIYADSTHTFDVTLRTYGFKLLRYYFSKPNITIEATAIQNKNDHFLWTNVAHSETVRQQFSPNVQVIGIQSDSLKFMCDKLSVKHVAIVLNQDVSYAKGFDLVGRFNLKPDSVKVIGPKSRVDSIMHIDTEVLILNNVKESVSRSLNLKLPKSISGLKLSETRTLIKGEIDKYTEGSIQVPIVIKNIPDNMSINYFPKKVTVFYNTSLTNYNTIKAQDFKVECDYGKLLPNATYLIPEITLQPETIKAARINQKKIEFIVSK